jgi:ribulose-5-phosphate 4-epimerase/fuculose-1-phosphate aldolase
MAQENGYVGVKFAARMVGRTWPNNLFSGDSRLDELKYWCKIFHEKGLAPPYKNGSFGNLSFRVEPERSHFVITASNSSLANSADNRFSTVVGVNLQKRIVSAIGLRKPSSEAMVHYIIYRELPEIQAVFHGHSEVISRNLEKLGIRETFKEEPYGTLPLVLQVQEAINRYPEARFIQMKNHGFISFGSTLEEAGGRALFFLDEARKLK